MVTQTMTLKILYQQLIRRAIKKNNLYDKKVKVYKYFETYGHKVNSYNLKKNCEPLLS